jgi:hypothetical protein
VSSNEVGVIVNPTVSEFTKVSFSINLAVFWASGLARVLQLSDVSGDPKKPLAGSGYNESPAMDDLVVGT